MRCTPPLTKSTIPMVFDYSLPTWRTLVRRGEPTRTQFCSSRDPTRQFTLGRELSLAQLARNCAFFRPTAPGILLTTQPVDFLEGCATRPLESERRLGYSEPLLHV